MLKDFFGPYEVQKDIPMFQSFSRAGLLCYVAATFQTDNGL